jgi:hypothetical protein
MASITDIYPSFQDYAEPSAADIVLAVKNGVGWYRSRSLPEHRGEAVLIGVNLGSMIAGKLAPLDGPQVVGSASSRIGGKDHLVDTVEARFCAAQGLFDDLLTPENLGILLRFAIMLIELARDD